MEATPTTHSSLTARTGFPLSSFRPLLGSPPVATIWSTSQPLLSSLSPVVR